MIKAQVGDPGVRFVRRIIWHGRGFLACLAYGRVESGSNFLHADGGASSAPLPADTAESEEVHAAAIGLGQEALATHRETRHRLGEARTLAALARAHRKTGNAAAEPTKQLARAIFSDIGILTSTYENLDR